MARRHIIILLTGLLALSSCSDNLTPHPERELYVGQDPQALPCVPNLDGRIEAHEMQPALGVPAHFRISPASETRAVDVVGATDQHGVQVWDWSRDDASDQALDVTARPVDGWYASSFPAGEFVSDLAADGGLEAVYSHTSTGIFLHGYASRIEVPTAGKTLVVYEEPVALYRFPLKAGDEWVATGLVRNATLMGLPYAGQDVYSIKIDAAGELWLPDLEFTQVLRARTHVTIQPAVGQPTSRRQVSFLFECFGEVARATSRSGEENANFTTATEVRRLGFTNR